MGREQESPSRRHHTVSRFYLSGFADSAGQLTQTHLPGHKSHPISLTDASVQVNFYSLLRDDGVLDDWLERALAPIEAEAARVFQAGIADNWPLDPASKGALSSWIALQYVRGPAIRNLQTQLAAQEIRMIVFMAGLERLREVIEKFEGAPIGDDRLEAEWADLTKPEGPTLEPDVRFHADSMRHMHEWLSRVIHESQWMLVTFSRKALITCDHPVSLVAPEDHDGFTGVGLATADSYIIPLTRRVGLTIHPHNRGVDLKAQGTTMLWKAFSEHALHNARKFLFSHPHDRIPYELGTPAPREFEVAPMDASIFEVPVLRNLPPLSDEEIEARRRIEEMSRPVGPTISAADLVWPIPRRVSPPRP